MAFGTQQGLGGGSRGAVSSLFAPPDAGSLAWRATRPNEAVPLLASDMLPKEARTCLRQSRSGTDHFGGEE